MKSLLLLLLILLQDGARHWERPVEVDHGDYITALAIDGKGDLIRVDAMDYDADGNLRIGRRESADGGATWQRNHDCPIGLLSPVSTLSREKDILGFFSLPDGGFAVWDIDAKTGKKIFNEPFNSDFEFEDASSATLLEFKGDLWLFTRDGNDALVYQSKDGGKKWELRNKDWECHQDAGTAMLFESGGALHAMYADGYYSTDDQGKTWKKQTSLPGVPLAAVAAGPKIIAIGGTRVEGSEKLDVRSYSSADGGATWVAGGKIGVIHDHPDAPRPSLIASGDRLALFDNDWLEEGDELKITTIAMLSEDGGKTWEKIDFKNGMARDSVEPIGLFLGKDLIVAYSNFEKYARTDAPEEDDDHAAIPGYLLVRRWTDRKAPGPLTDEERKQIAAWIAQLGESELAVREKAQQNLLKMGDRALPVLDKAAAETTDAEVKSRLAALQKHYRAEWWK